MPITLSDIAVPFAIRSNEHGDEDYRCTLCDRVVGHDYNLQPVAHTLDECLGLLREKVERIITDRRRG